jgi:hypothetical protein
MDAHNGMGKPKSITYGQGGEEYPTYNKKKKG